MVGDMVKSVRKKSADKKYGWNKQRESNAKRYHVPQVRIAAHPTIRLAAGIKMSGNLCWQMCERECQAADET